MDNLGQNIPAYNGNSEPKIRTTRKDYPSEVEEIYRQDSQQLFDIKDCRVRTYAEGMAECLTPQFCHSCGNSIPFASVFFCKHPLLVKRVHD